MISSTTFLNEVTQPTVLISF